MKLVTYETDGQLRLGAVYEDRVADLAALASGDARSFGSMRAFLNAGDAGIREARLLLDRAVADGRAGGWPALRAVRLKAPIPDPGSMLALAGNYREHLREGGLTPMAREHHLPELFMKPVTCVAGPDEPIRLPGPICTAVDYEAELGVVIGRMCHDVPPHAALDYVAGYLNYNDVSGRKLNLSSAVEITPRRKFFTWLSGKWFDSFAPMGPFLVLKDEVPDPQNLRIELRVNGAVRQQATTGDMIFSVAETIAWISQFITLQPGDVIATGTPAGVGSATGTFLQAGDVVEMEVAGLGVLRNPVTAAVAK